jgi:hypothetical protein
MLVGMRVCRGYFLKSIRNDVEVPGCGWFSPYAPHEFIDTLSFGPIYLREIEWIEFPSFVPRQPDEPISPATPPLSAG